MWIFQKFSQNDLYKCSDDLLICNNNGTKCTSDLVACNNFYSTCLSQKDFCQVGLRDLGEESIFQYKSTI